MLESLKFDFDDDELAGLIAEFEASPRLISLASTRALRRTASALRRLSSKGLQTDLGLRNATALRRRLKKGKVEFTRRGGQVELWYGLNDLALSAFKGRPTRTADGVKLGDDEIKGAFFGKVRSKRLGLKRVRRTRYPIAEARRPISDRMMIYLEDNIFVDAEGIYLSNLRHELYARSVLGVGFDPSKRLASSLKKSSARRSRGGAMSIKELFS